VGEWLLNKKMISLVFLLSLFLIASQNVSASQNYDYFLTGNQMSLDTSTTGGIMLMGGGPDVDEAFKWMIDRSGAGDFVVLRASGADGYNDYLMSLGDLNSVKTFVMHNREAAFDAFILQSIRDADAIFFAGGDQNRYVSYIKGTPLEEEIHQAIAREVPIGGTSAGMHILGEHVYDARNGGVTSSEALRNPYQSRVTFTDDFLRVPLLNNVVTDTHFYERDRMGRLLTFIARNIADGATSVSEARGIGLDEGTAFVISPNGIGHALGNGYAYFLNATRYPEEVTPNRQLSFTGVKVQRVVANSSQSFSLGAWAHTNGIAYTLNVTNGRIVSDRSNGRIY
jgi:cyanophycinase